MKAKLMLVAAVVLASGCKGPNVQAVDRQVPRR